MKTVMLSALLLLTACGNSESDKSEIDQLRQENADLQAQLATIREKADALETASDNLQEQLERFKTEDWRDVMPNAVEAGEGGGEAQKDFKEATNK